jgi:hypothetical protein
MPRVCGALFPLEIGTDRCHGHFLVLRETLCTLRACQIRKFRLAFVVILKQILFYKVRTCMMEWLHLIEPSATTQGELIMRSFNLREPSLRVTLLFGEIQCLVNYFNLHFSSRDYRGKFTFYHQLTQSCVVTA